MQKITTFSNIREESESSHSILPAPQASVSNCHHAFDQTADSHGSSTTGGLEQCSSCGLVVGSRSRPNPQNLQKRALSPLPSRIRLVRPLSSEFKRSTSTFDEQPETRLTHRRTQSYAPPSSFLKSKCKWLMVQGTDDFLFHRVFFQLNSPTPHILQSLLLICESSMQLQLLPSRRCSVVRSRCELLGRFEQPYSECKIRS